MEETRAIVEVMPGVCKFSARIINVADEMFSMILRITSDCEHIRQLAERLKGGRWRS